MSNDKMDGLPEGIYVDKDAIAKETERIVNVVLTEVVANISDQTKLIAEIDNTYARQDIPMFIREQAAQRLGDILMHISISPTVDRLYDIMKDKQCE